MQTTKKKYYKDGEYETDRRILHDKIIADALEGTLLGNPTPESFLVGGGSGSGKGYATRLIIDAYKSNGESVVHIDADAIKEQLPEYNQLIISRDIKEVKKAAWVVHDESSDIAEEILNICIADNRHFIYDGTMKNEEKYNTLISRLREKSYRIRAFVVDVPLDIAIQRAEQRFRDTLRYVPKSIIIESHDKIAGTFFSIKEKVDEYVLYDNTVDGEPVEQFAYKISEEGEKVINLKRLKQFYAKSKIDIEEIEVKKEKNNQ